MSLHLELVFADDTPAPERGRNISVVLDDAKPDFVIGQSNDADLPVNDPSLCFHHCRLSRSAAGDAGGVELVNLDECGFTFCNGNLIETTIPLKDGDRVEIGGASVLGWGVCETSPAAPMPTPEAGAGLPPSAASHRSDSPGLDSRGAGSFGSSGSSGSFVPSPGPADPFVERAMSELARAYPDRVSRRTRRELQAMI